MSALDLSMLDLIERHGLLNVGITCHNATHFSVSLQWDRKALERGCVIENGKSTAEALGKAIAAMQAERSQEPTYAFDGELAA
jgi:hypothetical protein